MSLEKEIREKLIAEAADYKKLDQLVRQGMMSPAQLPMLHRGLDKMQSGKVLNPQEREAVNKVMQSMLFIVTGDSQVFNKARQHTQKTRYQTESYTEEEVRELCHSKDHDCAVTVNHPKWGLGKPIYESHAIPDDEGNVEWYDVQFKHGIEKEVPAADMEILQSEGHEKTMYASTKKGKAKNSKQQAAIAIAKKEKGLDEYGMVTASTKKSKKKKPSVYAMAAEESPAEDKLDSGYKAKFQAMLKKTGKSLKDMSDEEKKKFFNAVDASHSAKDESVNEEDIKEYITSKQVKMAKGIAFDKRHKGGDMTGAAKKMEKIKKGLSNHPGAKKALRQANEEDELQELKMHKNYRAIKSYAAHKASDHFKKRLGTIGSGGTEGDTVKSRSERNKDLKKMKKAAKKGLSKSAGKAVVKRANKIGRKHGKHAVAITSQDPHGVGNEPKQSWKSRRSDMKSGYGAKDSNSDDYKYRVGLTGEQVAENQDLEERNKENAMKRKMMDASRGARYKLNNPNVPDSDHKTPQAKNKAIGRALRSFEDANSDSIENQEKMNRKMKRKSDANARKERETDHGYKAAMKESLIDKVVDKLNEGMKTTGSGVKMMPPVKGTAGKTQKVGGKLSHPPRKPNRLKPDPSMSEGGMKRMATQAAEKKDSVNRKSRATV